MDTTAKVVKEVNAVVVCHALAYRPITISRDPGTPEIYAGKLRVKQTAELGNIKETVLLIILVPV